MHHGMKARRRLALAEQRLAAAQPAARGAGGEARQLLGLQALEQRQVREERLEVGLAADAYTRMKSIAIAPGSRWRYSIETVSP
jgi:hypothetical protein